MTAAIHVTWRTRAVPLSPQAVAAAGPVAARLVDRLLTFTDDALTRLRGVAGPDLLVLTGESADLPWLDGVEYLGRDPLAPGLYIPTTLEPAPVAALLERALRQRAPQLAPPLALVSLAEKSHESDLHRPAPGDSHDSTRPPSSPPRDSHDSTLFVRPRLVSLADARPLVRARLRAWRGLA
ncbi:bpX5 domain-containing protein [Nannocystis punicea]|uniref:MoxR-vWA-beta-propeller ternary system domain-containing protein n=1 Tax=Nannocystis punicea TaxID=2995304 RepID=A0ABY7GZQ9_9BACT|nr:hypothetical protein [Nannocystis poenicansa]WAS92418.1 hypothetical protein O0S08_40080 [Nannocystis poenicansa]